MKAQLAITGVGMMTPVGHGASICLHAVRSSVSRLAELPYPDRVQTPVVGGKVLWQTRRLRANRLRELAETALEQAWRQACGGGDRSKLGTTGLLMGVPEPIRPGYRFPPKGFELAKWFSGLGVGSVGPVQVVAGGSCSAQFSLERAAEMIARGEVQTCVIGAADTQLQLRTIRWHENHYRLKCAYMNDGLMPGEAACFLVVESEPAATARGATILARVLAVAWDKEEATILSDKPNTAKGLTAAARKALADAEVAAADLDSVWCDLNGESYRGREWAFAEVRLGVQTHTELVHPADCHGDLGAAADAGLLGIAAYAQATRWAHRRPVLVFSGSEAGVRAATVVGPPPDQPDRPMPQPVTEGLPAPLPVDQELPPLGPDEVDFSQTDNPPRAYFDWQLRQEHLEELASLYYQRQALLHDPEIEWFRAAEPEQRILNHLDAAAAAGATSVWAVASGIRSDDEGSCFAGAMMLGVLSNGKNFALVDQALTDPSATNVAGIEQGLKRARNRRLAPHVEAWLRHEATEVRAMAISLAGYLGLVDPASVARFLDGDEPVLIRAAASAMRRLRHTAAAPALERALEHGDPSVRHESLLSLLCLGWPDARNYCRRLCLAGASPETGAPLLLSLCGEPADLDVLLEAARRPLCEPHIVEAVGVLGNVEAAPLLLEALGSNDDAVKVAAGSAMELITAAGLREEAVVVEQVEGFEEGEVEDVEETVQRVCTSPEAWSDWWVAHGTRFDPRRRWRLGQPFDAGVCIAEIAAGRSLYHDRQRAYWELVIRTGHDVPFEPDWFVPRQRHAIGRWRTWWRNNQSV